jgi:prepilin-type N-terminal cleavage/methylation domain-containing protein
MKRLHKDKGGFTLIELMIATTIFSVILLLGTFAMLQIGKMYYKGINSSRTQAVARSVSDSVTQAIQFSGTQPRNSTVATGNLTPAGSGAVCIGSQRFSYQTDKIVSDSPSGPNEARHALIVDVAPAGGLCPAVNFASPPPGSRELLAPNMRLVEFGIEESAAGYLVTVSVTTGPYDLSDGTGGITVGMCEGGTGSQFCANSKLITVAKRRL